MEHHEKTSAIIIRVILFSFIIIYSIFAVYHLYHSFGDYKADAEKEAVVLARSAAALIDPAHLRSFELNEADLENPDYQTEKRQMIAFKEENEEVEFAYIYTIKGEIVYFMVDSEFPDSVNYSPPGQEYDEASGQDIIPFETREATLFEPITDRWGTWISAVAPIIDYETGEVIAAFGIDYPAAYWNAQITRHMMQDIAILGFIFLILLGLYILQLKNRHLKSITEKLEKSEALFRTVFEQAPVGIALVDDFHFHSDVNTKLLNILGRTKTELASLNWTEITHPDDLQKDLDQFARFTAGEIPGYSMEKRFRRPDGSYIWTNMVVAELQIKEDLKGKRHLAIISDINTRKLAEDALSESERSKSLLLSNLPGMAYRCLYDKEWTMEFLSDGCYDLTGYEPESLLNNKEIAFNDLIVPEARDIIRDEWARVLKLRMPFHYEYEIVTRDKEHKWVLETGQGIFSPDGAVLALEGLIIDITDAKKRMDEIRYMDAHDFMTGLYNRKYYAQEKQRLDSEGSLPISILLADINGLRMINDAFGHAEGDRMIIETARIIQSCCRKKDILARTGGDEFSILLPDTSLNEVAEVAAKIEEACEKYNQLIANSEQYLSLSSGFAEKGDATDTLEKTEKEAEESLHKKKLFEQKSYYSAILSSIMATMYARSQETEEHAQRLGDISLRIGERLGLPQHSLGELQIFSMLHDLGKVGIDDRILNKAGSLSQEEWAVMKTHPEIGWQIAMSVPELQCVSDCILYHHEKWDGTGYPHGKQGEDIPLLARILAVADAYDAMTENRIYRSAMSKKSAIAEIEINAGTQFDPAIVKIFLDLMSEEAS